MTQHSKYNVEMNGRQDPAHGIVSQMHVSMICNQTERVGNSFKKIDFVHLYTNQHGGFLQNNLDA